MKRSLWMLFVLLGLFFLGAVCSLWGQATELKISPANPRKLAITRNGNTNEIFLLEVSYFSPHPLDTINSSTNEQLLITDLETFKQNGFNCIRVNAIDTRFPIFKYNALTKNFEKNLDDRFYQRINKLIKTCDDKGIVIDFTLFVINESSSFMPQTDIQAQSYLHEFTNAFKGYKNWFWDVCNEWDFPQQAWCTLENVKKLLDQVKSDDPARLCTASSNSTDGSFLMYTKLDIIAPHTLHCGWASLEDFGSKDLVDPRRYAIKPIHLQEPPRRGYDCAFDSYYPDANRFLNDLRAVRSTDAAGWCLHNFKMIGELSGIVVPKCSYLDENYGLLLTGGPYPYVGQFEPEEQDVVLFAASGIVSEITVISPNNGEIWTQGSSHDIKWTWPSVAARINIDYSTDNGTNWTSVVAGTENNGIYSWTVPNTPSTNCLVRIRGVFGTKFDISDAAFKITSVESISQPIKPLGPGSGLCNISYTFRTDSAVSSSNHNVQYKFDWGNGDNSGWLPVGTTTASHSWTFPSTQEVMVKARCSVHTAIESPWSAIREIDIINIGLSGKYNSPAQSKLLPEVIWAQAAGGGTWISEVQVTDVTGSSQVSLVYNTATGRRGPFLIWDNTAGAALSSVKFTNLLETLDGLDSGAFAYYGTVGTVEFITQDVSHLVQAAAREVNGDYSKTFTALSLHDANTATTSRAMIVSNLSNNATYRSTCGFFNPTSDAVTVEFTLLDGGGAQIGSQFSKTLAGHGFQAFNPFTQAGVPYPGNAYSNAILRVRPTTGSGKVMCFGATANNTSNDPAAHVAVQGTTSYDNGPSRWQVLPEVTWAAATGGGTWVSAVQVTDVTGGSQLSVYFNTAAGRRGPFLLWNNTGGALSSINYTNLLKTIDGLDTGIFTYYGTVGAVEFSTQDSSHTVLVTSRMLIDTKNCSKTFPGLNLVDAETAYYNSSNPSMSRAMLIQNLTNNATYRSSCGFFNPTANTVTVEFTLLNGSGAQIGSHFSKTFVGYDFKAFSPFTEAGMPYPANAYDNVILRVRPTSGLGKVVCFGASANNASNDPASHLAVQAQ